ncbi:MAG: RNA polymerase sigma factor [Acutalibacteraceae bacterium]
MDFEKIYNTYYMQVYSYVMTLAKSRDIAEEITQNTFYKALSAKSSFRGESDELTYLCSIAKNIFFDEMRRRKKFDFSKQSNEITSEENIEKAISDSDSAYQIHLILHNLEEPYKEVFSLRVFGELPFAQIASIFQKSESWARVTYHRARLKIRERIDNDNE